MSKSAKNCLSLQQNLNGQSVGGVSEQLSSTPQFWVLNRKINVFEEKRVLSVVFIKLKCRWLQNGLADLKKHQTLKILLRVNFACIFSSPEPKAHR